VTPRRGSTEDVVTLGQPSSQDSFGRENVTCEHPHDMQFTRKLQG